MTLAASGEAVADARLPPEQAAWMRALAGQARAPLAFAVALPLLSGVLLLPQAWALAQVLQMIVVDRQPLSAALPLIGFAGALVLLRAALVWMAEHAGQHAAESVKRSVRLALFRRLLSAGVLWSRARASGELADALTARVETLDGYFARYLPAMASAAILPLVFCVVLFGFDWIAALVLVLTVTAIPRIMALMSSRNIRRIRSLIRRSSTWKLSHTRVDRRRDTTVPIGGSSKLDRAWFVGGFVCRSR